MMNPLQSLTTFLLVTVLLSGCMSSMPSDPVSTPGWLEECQQRLGDSVGRDGESVAWDDLPMIQGMPCNVVAGSQSTLVIPPFDPASVSMVRSAVHGADIDWVFVQQGPPAIVLVQNGSADRILLKQDWPAPLLPGAQRSVTGLDAQWLADELHVLVQTRIDNPSLVPDEIEDATHLWWSKESAGEEALAAPAFPGQRVYSRLAADGGALALSATDYGPTDVLGQTDNEVSMVWTTAAAGFDGPTRLPGVWLKDIAVADGQVHGCAVDGTQIRYGMSPDWGLEPVMTVPGVGVECLMAISDQPEILAYGLPLVGGGGGSSGSGDAESYRLAHRQNGSWDVDQLDRTIWSQVDFAATPDGPFFADDSHDGTNSTELWIRNGTHWVKAWGQDGPTAHVIRGLQVPAVYAGAIHDDHWDYPDPAVLIFPA